VEFAKIRRLVVNSLNCNDDCRRIFLARTICVSFASIIGRVWSISVDCDYATKSIIRFLLSATTVASVYLLVCLITQAGSGSKANSSLEHRSSRFMSLFPSQITISKVWMSETIDIRVDSLSRNSLLRPSLSLVNPTRQGQKVAAAVVCAAV
jgi:hypothetical protein